MTSLDIFNPLFTLFEYIYNIFAVFGEIAQIPLNEITSSFLNENYISLAISNPFNENIFSFVLNLGDIGNGIVDLIFTIVDWVSVIPSTQPLYIHLLVISIPLIIIFWLVNIVKKAIS